MSADDRSLAWGWSVFLSWLGWPVALCAGGIMLLGIPGALLMEIASPVSGLFTGKKLPADSAWPMAIILALIWPWFMLPGRWLAGRLLRPGAPWWRGVSLAALAFALVCGVVLAAVLQVGAGRL
jgi:hypothetical protein